MRTATWRPFQAGTSRAATRFQVSGRRWRSSRASVISCFAVTGCDPQGDGEGFGGVGRDLRAALATERLVGQECFAAPGGDTGLGGGGMHDGPLVGDEQLVPRGCRVRDGRRRRGGRAAPRGSGLPGPSRVAASLMGLVKQGPPTLDRPRKPLFHRGSERLDLIARAARWLGDAACACQPLRPRVRPAASGRCLDGRPVATARGLTSVAWSRLIARFARCSTTGGDAECHRALAEGGAAAAASAPKPPCRPGEARGQGRRSRAKRCLEAETRSATARGPTA